MTYSTKARLARRMTVSVMVLARCAGRVATGAWMMRAERAGEIMAKTYVLVVRHPDAANNITTDGDVEVVDIDLGASFDSEPSNYESAHGFAVTVSRLDGVPVDSPVFSAAIETFYDTLRDWDNARFVIDEYVAERRRHAA